jgi:RNA polymerase sigma factor (sigma-70 family)
VEATSAPGEATSAPGTVSLARRAHDGDSAALEELLIELQPLVVRAARLIVGSGSWAAEDAAQDALLDIARDIRRLREPHAVRAWAFRVATRRALKVARRERLLRVLRVVHSENVFPCSPEADERAAALKEAFDRLPPRLRATAVLRLQAGLSEGETANVLGCSVGTVKSNLHDARTRLTAMLTQSGYAPSIEAKEASA